MGIPEDYYRATGETMGQACRRLAPTTQIKIIAEIIGYRSATALQAALKARGIEITWSTTHPRRGGQRDRVTDAELDRWIALRHAGMRGEDAAKAVGRCQRALQKQLKARRPGQTFKRVYPRSTYTDDVLAKYAVLRAMGEPWDAAAEQLGVDSCNVYRAIRQYSPESRAA